LGVAEVLILEKGMEGRHAFGGFAAVPAGGCLPRVGNTLCLSGALLGYDVLSVVQRHSGEEVWVRMLFSPLPVENNLDREKTFQTRITRRRNESKQQ